MGRKFKTWRDPYDSGFSMCRRKEIEIEPGVTVLVGCNGAGKSTLIHNIKAELKEKKVPTFFYDNEKEGGSNSVSESFFYNDITFAATAMCSSEGENIQLNLGKIATKLRKFIETGENDRLSDRLAKAFRDKEEEKIISNERWILLDAMDSGYSIDNVIDMKDFFKLVIDDAKAHEKEVYIVISSNEYELVHKSNCFDVMEGKYISFASYDEYKKFILKTREKKDKRYNK